MISANDLSAAELAALLHFHADAGVEWLVEDDAVDRFADFAASQATHASSAPSHATATVSTRSPAPQKSAPERRSAPVAIPDDKAIEQARIAAHEAASLGELAAAVSAFNGCNLRKSARSTVFPDQGAAGGVMIIGPMPTADDDRDGQPFSGRAGQMLDRMLSVIGLDRARIMLGNVVPWRPPGDRMPSPIEIEICRPFIERQIALTEPRAIFLLGNFAARFFFGGTDTIHVMRGQWRDITVGQQVVPALASLHPQELLTAPINKRLAWSDLLALKARLAGNISA